MPFTVTMPKLSPTMEEGVIAKWHKKEGDYVKANELLLEIATDKATLEFHALDEGWLRKILAPEKATIPINQPIALFSESKEESIDELYASLGKKEREEAPKISAEAPVEKAAVQEVPGPRLIASPLARRLAKERGIDLTTIKGSGPGGRITSADLEKGAIKEKAPLPTAEIEEIPLTPMRKTIARRLQEAKQKIPHFYLKQLVDAEPLVCLREQLKQVEIRVTFNDLIIRACALALQKHPEVNRGFNSQNETIIQFKKIAISIAVSVPDGLITPILFDTDKKNLKEISAEAKELAERARLGKLKPEEYQGGSFCISNLGMYGTTEFIAVLNPPQAAILAVGAIEEQPVIKKGEIVAGKTLSLILSVDHRVIDGALAALFMKTLKQLLESPVSFIT
jgi:pyruvate dehydrogenase E2 component (dihydrolipoamide acetyltransferase)